MYVRHILILGFLLLPAGCVWAQADLVLRVEADDRTRVLRFGLMQEATEGLDADLGEEEMPPFPPAPDFEARFTGAALGLGSYRDYRPGALVSGGIREHDVRVQAPSGTEPRLCWSLPAYVHGYLVDAVVGRDTTKVTGTGCHRETRSAVRRWHLVMEYDADALPASMRRAEEIALAVLADTARTLLRGTALSVQAAPGAGTELRIVEAARFDDAPADPRGIEEAHVSGSRWTLALADGADAVRLRFDLGALPRLGITDTAAVQVYHRPVPGAGTFVHLASRLEAPGGALTIDGGRAGEYVLASDVDALPSAPPEPTPRDVALAPVYPNPVRGAAHVRYVLPEAAPLRLAVYDVLGREVVALDRGVRSPGEHALSFSSKRLAPGLYVVRLQVGSYQRARPLVVDR